MAGKMSEEVNEGGIERMHRVRCLCVCDCSEDLTVLTEKCSVCSQISNVSYIYPLASVCNAWLYKRPSSRRCFGDECVSN